MKNYKLFIIMAFLLSLQSCNLIWICKETNLSIRKSYKYKNQIGLTVKELKSLLVSDTSNYKILIFFSPCCGPCQKHFQTTYRKFYDIKDANVKFYFINDCCDGVRYNEKFLHSMGYYEQIYFIRDTSNLFNVNNILRYNNMLNYVFDLQAEKTIDGVFGIPISCIVNPRNEIKLIKCNYDNDIKLRNIPLPLYELTDINIKKIDFDKIEEHKIIKYDFCTPDDCK